MEQQWNDNRRAEPTNLVGKPAPVPLHPTTTHDVTRGLT
jgi:hypothetical protein